MIQKLNKKYKIILASGSPRRKELMQKAGYNFEIHSADVDESFSIKMKAEAVVSMLSKKKAIAVAERIDDAQALIIAADTIVVNETEILGKPANLEAAKKMLEKLSNTSHRVITGFCIKLGNTIETYSANTTVVLNQISITEIEHYCNNYEVLDKAGAYGIQDWIGLNKIKTINGCYYNVMGLPLSLLYTKLEKLLNIKNSTLA